MGKSLWYPICLMSLLRSIEPWTAHLERVDVAYADEKLFDFNTFVVSKYNHTDYVFNVNITVHKDIPPNQIAEFKLFGKFSNIYRPLPLELKRTVCNMFKYEYQWVAHLIKGNFPNKCPIQKDTYIVKDFILDVKNFPKFPWNTNAYKISGRLFIGKKDNFIVNAYIITNTDDEYKTFK